MQHDAPQLTSKTKTIMEDFLIALGKWLADMRQIVNRNNGISSYKIARSLGVTQKSASPVNHPICPVAAPLAFNMLSGTIEAPETQNRGDARNRQPSTRVEKVTGAGGKASAAVFRLPERAEGVFTRALRDTKQKRRQSEVSSHVLEQPAISNDAPQPCEALEDCRHQVTRDALEYVRG